MDDPTLKHLSEKELQILLAAHIDDCEAGDEKAAERAAEVDRELDRRRSSKRV